MEKLNILMTKRNVVFIGIAGILIAYFLQHYYAISTYLGLYQHTYRAIYKSIAWLSFPLTFVAFILFFLRDEIFQFWRKFAYLWVPAQILIVLLIIFAESNSVGGIFNIQFAEPISMLLSGAFLVVSFILVIIKYITLRRGA